MTWKALLSSSSFFNYCLYYVVFHYSNNSTIVTISITVVGSTPAGGADLAAEEHSASEDAGGGMQPFSGLTKASVEALRYRGEDIARSITKAVVKEVSTTCSGCRVYSTYCITCAVPTCVYAVYHSVHRGVRTRYMHVLYIRVYKCLCFIHTCSHNTCIQ